MQHGRGGDDNNNYQITSSGERVSQLTCCIVDVEERREWIILRHQAIANVTRHSLVPVLCLHLQDLQWDRRRRHRRGGESVSQPLWFVHYSRKEVRRVGGIKRTLSPGNSPGDNLVTGGASVKIGGTSCTSSTITTTSTPATFRESCPGSAYASCELIESTRQLRDSISHFNCINLHSVIVLIDSEIRFWFASAMVRWFPIAAKRPGVARYYLLPVWMRVCLIPPNERTIGPGSVKYSITFNPFSMASQPMFE